MLGSCDFVDSTLGTSGLSGTPPPWWQPGRSLRQRWLVTRTTLTVALAMRIEEVRIEVAVVRRAELTTAFIAWKPLYTASRDSFSSRDLADLWHKKKMLEPFCHRRIGFLLRSSI
ncbi:uncharacterized protein LOC113310754 isoform X3 [Papaver somniferum]|uniref:uncharacterized protein LOC113310754 isoform X3 n=1 Tax=Papaver somniferum TaxID=3469 RepID=UPI000E6F986D|nr:uncharacterized protein LOC113310754 isoform X3 [Papaver somniferum]